jgi:hypothetical protein
VGIASKIRKARALNAQQWLVLIRATALLWRAAWLLRTRPLPQALSRMEAKSSASPALTCFTAAEVSELVAIATRVAMPDGSCLPQALVTCRLLKQAGHRANLVIGARKPGVPSGGTADSPPLRFSAHAWVELAAPVSQEGVIAFNRGEHAELVKFSKTA